MYHSEWPSLVSVTHRVARPMRSPYGRLVRPAPLGAGPFSATRAAHDTPAPPDPERSGADALSRVQPSIAGTTGQEGLAVGGR